MGLYTCHGMGGNQVRCSLHTIPSAPAGSRDFGKSRRTELVQAVCPESVFPRLRSSEDLSRHPTFSLAY